MQNWSYTVPDGPHKGETIWSGRYCCIAGFIFRRNLTTQNVEVLANKRGQGTPNEQGKWNCICGFLDKGESAEQGLAREVIEETGISIDPRKFIFAGYQANATESNVTLRFVAHVRHDVEPAKVSELRGGETNEVEDIKWIPVKDIDSYEWAFNHRNLILEMVKKIYK